MIRIYHKRSGSAAVPASFRVSHLAYSCVLRADLDMLDVIARFAHVSQRSDACSVSAGLAREKLLPQDLLVQNVRSLSSCLCVYVVAEKSAVHSPSSLSVR